MQVKIFSADASTMLGVTMKLEHQLQEWQDFRTPQRVPVSIVAANTSIAVLTSEYEFGNQCRFFGTLTVTYTVGTT